MPQRPREHVLEQESRDALRVVLPAEWPLTWIAEDYGIDGRVDLFANGAASGLAFGAQLKATDEPDLKQALRTKISVSALNYMSAQADPVLLVRYHAPTGALYARWLHRKDVVLKRKQQKTVTVSWAASDRLDATGAGRLMEEVRRFRRFRSADLSPVSIAVSVQPPLEAHAATVTMLLNATTAGAGGLLQFGGDGPHDADVHLSAKMLRVDMSISSARIEFPNIETDPQDLAGNILVACAVCLSKVGRPDVAASIVHAAPYAPVLASEQVADAVAAAFTAAGRWREASDLARHHRATDRGTSPLSVALSLQLLLHADKIPLQDRRHIAENMTADAADKQAAGDTTAGAAWYCAANFLFNSVHDYPAALAAYENAAAARSDYVSQDYYLGELAAAQFETGAYDDAALTYSKAITLDPDTPGLIACYADALAHAGRYADAIAEFDRYQSAAGELPPNIWLLKRAALRTVLSRTGTSRQGRIAPPNDASPDETLDADALSPWAWMNIAVDSAAAGDDAGALDALLVACAFPSSDSPEPWPTMLQAAYQLELDDLFDALTAVAWGRHGDGLIADVIAHNGALDPQDLPAFLHRFDATVAWLRVNATGGVNIRVLHQDGTRDVVEIRTAAAGEQVSGSVARNR